MRLDWAAMLLLYAVGVQTVAPAPSAQSTPPRAPPPRGLGSLPSFATAKSDPVVAALAHTQARPAALPSSSCPQQSVSSPAAGSHFLPVPHRSIVCCVRAPEVPGYGLRAADVVTSRAGSVQAAASQLHTCAVAAHQSRPLFLSGAPPAAARRALLRPELCGPLRPKS